MFLSHINVFLPLFLSPSLYFPSLVSENKFKKILLKKKWLGNLEAYAALEANEKGVSSRI